MNQIFKKNQLFSIAAIFLFAITITIGCREEVKTQEVSKETNTKVIVEESVPDTTIILDTADTRPTESRNQ